MCPYDALPKDLTGEDSLLDIGCGFGHLAWYLVEIGSPLRYFGTDIDKRKIDLALGCSMRPSSNCSTNIPFSEATAPIGFGGSARPSLKFRGCQGASRLQDRFGNIVLLDVMYLMPWELQTSILDWALARLAPGPKSALVIMTMDEATGFSGFRTVAQEWIMVYLLRKTRSSGTIKGIRHFAAYLDFAKDRGYQCQIERLPTFNPSYILRMHR